MVWVRALEFLLVPPSGLFVLGLAGLLLAFTRWRRTGRWLAAACGLALLLLSVPWVQGACLATLDRYPDADFGGRGAGAIVILGAGVRTDASGLATVSRPGIERLELGAELHRRTALPILVSGYSGERMAGELELRSAAVRWIEGTSRNTHQNALRSAAILRRDGVSRVYLVTHFWHMPRALAAFRHAGIDVVPAPAGRTLLAAMRHGRRAYIPDRRALAFSAAVFHEWVGRGWYRLRYGY